MEKTWKPTTAGILSIVAGAFCVIAGIVLATIGTIGGATFGGLGLPFVRGLVTGAIAVPLVPGVVAIVGGIYALRRRVWGLALAGAICALFGPWFVLGVLAIIFVALGKGEFE